MSEQLQIIGNEVVASSPEGKTARMTLEALLASITPQEMNTGDVILPHGVRAVVSVGALTIWIHETPPRLYRLKWIAEDSPAAFGKGARYREVCLALPYVVVLAVFSPGHGGQLQLQGFNECFFRVAPLASLDDELCYPALLNCSKYTPPQGRPLSWICTQHLNFARLAAEPDPNKRLRASFDALYHCLFETGFNYSSEKHEGSSWFSESRQCDERIRTVDNWQKASQEKSFVLDVPWLKTGYSVRQVATRIAENMGIIKPPLHTAADLARVLFNHPSRKRSRRTPSELQELMHALGI